MRRFEQTARPVGRDVELQTMDDFLDIARLTARVLLVEGDPGVGKSTLWRAGVEAAQGRSYRVLTCAPSAAEARLAYAALGDLLEPMLAPLLPELPRPQRHALQVALLQAEADGPADERAIAMAFLSVLRLLTRTSPILVAVDDAHWLDEATARVLSFALRRLDDMPVRVLVCVRTGGDIPIETIRTWSWDGSPVRRLRLGPLTLAALHNILLTRVGVQISRRALLRIHGAAEGNMFYALEIGREVAARAEELRPGEALPIPMPLRDLVRRRVAALPPATRGALLGVAALAHPSSRLIAMMDPHRRAAEVLKPAIHAELITLDDGRLRFAHPLLASAVYGETSPEDRRALHRRLARLVTGSEERARHLALAADGPDEAVASALDAAAVSAGRRGAPAAAAELCELAAGLSLPEVPGSSRTRRVDAAEHHFVAGDRDRARRLLDDVLPACPPGPERARVLRLLGRVRYHLDSFPEALRLLRLALAEVGDEPAARAAVLHDLTYVIHAQADVPAAATHARAALAAAEEHGDPGLLAEALAIVTVIDFLLGRGIDEPRMRRALALEDVGRRTPTPMRPSLIYGMLMSWVGESGLARRSLENLRARLVERGHEAALPFLAFALAFDDCARGDLQAAARHAAEGLEAADRSGTDMQRAHALTAQAVADAYLGRVESARDAAEEAIALCAKVGCPRWSAWPRSVLGFTYLSVGDVAAAAATLRPLVAAIQHAGIDDPAAAPFLIDAVEALAATGDLAQAEETLRWFEERRRERDRPWISALGLRGLGVLRAARGDVAGGLAALEEAVGTVEPVDRPVDLGRTLLVLGQLQRRANRRRQARDTLHRALAVLDGIGAGQWATRSRLELDRLGLRRPGGQELTPRELQIAERAAAGATNRAIAAALSVSPKTVEANLARIYRKLGIGSRAQLGAVMAGRTEIQKSSS